MNLSQWKDKSPTHALDLSVCVVTRATPDETDGQPGLKVTVPGVRDFVFCAKSASQIDEWMQDIYQMFVPVTYGGNGNGGAYNGTRLSQSPSFNRGTVPNATGMIRYSCLYLLI